jgi:hypothetical protein
VGKEKLGPILRKLTMSEGAVNGESVGKATCGGAPTTQSPRTVSPCNLNLRPDHHGRRLGAGGETISRQNDWPSRG